MSLLCGTMRLRITKNRDGDESLLPRDWDASPAAVRIPNDPASQMTVRHDFVGSLKDELTISRGETVNTLDVDRKWAFVAVADDGKNRSGFVPLSCLGPLKKDSELSDEWSTSASFTRTHDKVSDSKLVTTETNLLHNVCSTGEPRIMTIRNAASKLVTDDMSSTTGYVSVFSKDQIRHYVVLYDFMACNENDVSVIVGECVTSLNEDDPDWTWVRKRGGDEGFVPRGFLYSDVSGRMDETSLAEGSTDLSLSKAQEHHKLQLYGTELMSLYDYQGRLTEDLTVLRGDLLYADMMNQTHDEWLWAYCPRTQTCGFIPREYARPPALE